MCYDGDDHLRHIGMDTMGRNNEKHSSVGDKRGPTSEPPHEGGDRKPLNVSYKQDEFYERHLIAVLDSIPSLILYIDRFEIYRYVNSAFENWFDLPKEKILGQSVEELLGPDAYQKLKPRLEKVLSGETVLFEDTIDYDHGSERSISVSYVPDVGPDGKVAGFYALVHDVSALRNTEELLDSTRDRLRVITESFTDYAILSSDVEGLIKTWNSGAQNIFGYTEEEIIGQPAEILFTPEDVAKEIPDKEMKMARMSGRAVDERWHIRKDGSRFFASGIMSPLYVSGKLTGYAKIASDLTEKKKITESLQSAHDEMELRVAERTRALAETNEMLRAEYEERVALESGRIQLLQRILTIQEDERRRISRDLHDQLGQLTTGLRLKIASLVEATTDDPDISCRVAKIQDIAASLDSEISFLAWELRPSALEELGLIEALKVFVDGWSRHYDMAVEFHVSGLKDINLAAEIETHLYRIAQEALNNIAKHAKASRVNVILEKPKNSLVLIIEDDGVGFDPEEAVKIFESGRGLGLLGITERATLLGGEAEFESSPGKGATIYVRVPL